MDFEKADKLIKIILSRFKIFRGHYDFDDLYQEGMVIYLKCEKMHEEKKGRLPTLFSRSFKNFLISFLRKKQEEKKFLSVRDFLDCRDYLEEIEVADLEEKLVSSLDEDEKEIWEKMKIEEGNIEEKEIPIKLKVDQIRKKFTSFFYEN